MAINNPVKIIGQAETISLPEVTSKQLHARIDTGAQTSAIWASYIQVKHDKLEVIFFGPEHPSYTGNKVLFDEFSHSLVTSSNGQAELRYKIKLRLVIGNKTIKSRFTLADRSTQLYAVLIGRNVLRGKFVVDVTLGKVLKRTEQERLLKLQARNNKGETK
jgi:hypothetical protein